MTQVQARYYNSGAVPTVLNSSLGTSGNPVVTGPLTGWPTSYPFVALIDWGNFGTPQQEAVLVSNVTGTGPYTLVCAATGAIPGTRGFDTTGASAHSSGATVFHAFTGADFQDMAIQRATQTVTWGAGAQTADVSTAATYVVALTGNVTPVTLAGAPATGVEASLTFYFSQPSSGTTTYTVGGWPASVQWLAGSAPVIATGASALTVVTLETFNGGTTWYGTGPAPPLPLPVPYGGSGATNLQPYQAVMGGITLNSPVASQILPAKPPCRVATTGPLPANSYAGGSLTASFNGVLPAIDGQTLILNDRLVVMNEAAQANNGIYQLRLTGTGTTITNGAGISAGATSMTVASITGISNGATLRLDAGNAGAENVTVTAPPSGSTVTFTACANPHANGAPVGITGWAFDRVPDMIDTTNPTVQVPGATTWVTSGTVNANTEWAVQGPGPFTLGSTPITWQQIGGAAVSPGGSGLIPTDLSLAAWTFDPGFSTGSSQPSANGDQLLSLVVLRYPKTITELAFLLAGFAVSPTAGRNWIEVYPAAGGAALVSADCTAYLTSGSNSLGVTGVPCTATTLPAGQYVIGAFFNAGTLPALGNYTAGSAVLANAGLPNFRYGHVAGGYTTSVPSLTVGSVTQLSAGYWFGMG